MIVRMPEPDRNLHLGGRSFYFFDLDDNLIFLTTPCYLFHKTTGCEVEITSRDFALYKDTIGISGPYRDYEMRFDEATGTFRRFRDQDVGQVEAVLLSDREPGHQWTFIDDLAHALGLDDVHWQGPSWPIFYRAVYNQRLISVITGRGHHPETLKEGFRFLVRNQHLPAEPNYLSVYPVSHPEIKKELSEGLARVSVPELKRAAIRASVETAIEIYGESEYHRFGMSDDDPSNVDLVVEEMRQFKNRFNRISFFVFEAQPNLLLRREIFQRAADDVIVSLGEPKNLWNL